VVATANTPVTAQGTTIGIGATPTNILNLTSIDGLDVKLSTIDTTTLDATSSYKTFVGGFKEVSDVALAGFLDAQADATLWTAINTAGQQAAQAFTIQFPAVGGQTTGTKWTFNGIVTGFKTKAGIGALVTFDATIKVSGAPTITWGA
jgi:predicted secreted protein